MMRKVWFREGRIDRDPAREADLAALAAAEERLRQNPNSRDRHREFVRALSRAGELERAVDAAEEWLSRDRLDWEALTYLSDAVGRTGERERALRLLSGIVDLEPDNMVLQQRMAGAFERGGDRERACAHYVTMAEMEPSEANLEKAVGCTRRQNQQALGQDLLELAEPAVQRRVDDFELEVPSVRGDLLATATWSGGSDVDLSLVTPEGTRISWMG